MILEGSCCVWTYQAKPSFPIWSKNHRSQAQPVCCSRRLWSRPFLSHGGNTFWKAEEICYVNWAKHFQHLRNGHIYLQADKEVMVKRDFIKNWIIHALAEQFCLFISPQTFWAAHNAFVLLIFAKLAARSTSAGIMGEKFQRERWSWKKGLSPAKSWVLALTQ